MSLYIGPDSKGRKILHTTDSVVGDPEDMKGNPRADTLLHSEMPYIVVKDSFKLPANLNLTYINNTPFNGGLGHRAMGNGSNSDNSKSIDQGTIPQEVKNLLSAGYFYLISLKSVNLNSIATLPAHINMCGAGNLSPLYGGWQSVTPALSVGGSIGSFTASVSAYPSGGSFFNPVQITRAGFTGSRAMGSITPNRDRVLKYNYSGSNNDLYIPSHDHVLNGNSNYYQFFGANGATKNSGTVQYVINGTRFPRFPANPGNNDPHILITFFNIKLVNGRLIHEPIAGSPGGGVKVSKDELTLNGVNLLDHKFLQFNAPKTIKNINDFGRYIQVPDLYDNVEYYQTSVNCTAPTAPTSTRSWWDLNDMSYQGMQEGSNLAALQIEGGSHVLPNTLNWGDGVLGGPNVPMGRLGGIPLVNVSNRRDNPVQDPNHPYKNGYGISLNAPGQLHSWRDYGRVTASEGSSIYNVSGGTGYDQVVDHNGIGIYRNPQASEFCTVDMSVVSPSIELTNDEIKLGTSSRRYYTDLFTKGIKPSYVISDLKSIVSPKTTVPNFSLSGINGKLIRTTRNDTLITSIEAGFSRTEEPAIGWLQLDPANGGFIAEASITTPIDPNANRHVDSVEINSTRTNPIPGLFNFKNGKYIPLISWVMGQRNSSTDATSNTQSMIRAEVYAKRNGSKLEIRYMIWASCATGSNTSNLRPTISGIKIPGLTFKFATLYA